MLNIHFKIVKIIIINNNSSLQLLNRNVKPTNSEIANTPIHTNTEITYSMRRLIQTFIIKITLYYPIKSCHNILLFYFCKSVHCNLIT